LVTYVHYIFLLQEPNLPRNHNQQHLLLQPLVLLQPLLLLLHLLLQPLLLFLLITIGTQLQLHLYYTHQQTLHHQHQLVHIPTQKHLIQKMLTLKHYTLETHSSASIGHLATTAQNHSMRRTLITQQQKTYYSKMMVVVEHIVVVVDKKV